MTRTRAANGPALEDDQLYQGVLVYAKFVKSKRPDYVDQIEVEWELRQGLKLRDWPSLALGITAATKRPSRLRQLLNALAEKPKDAELWFDPDTLEWGYDLDGDDSTPAYAKLTAGMVVMFSGENRKTDSGSRYKITTYRAVNGKATK